MKQFQMVYVGIRILEGKRRYLYLRLPEDFDLSKSISPQHLDSHDRDDWIRAQTKQSFWKKNPYRLAAIGGVYLFKSDDQDAVWIGGDNGPRSVGRWPYEYDKGRWGVLEEEAETMLKSSSAPNPVLEILEPLAVIYSKSNSLTRAVIVAQIIRYLESQVYREKVKAIKKGSSK